MTSKLVNIPAFRIVGICKRTTNQQNQSEKDIAELWKKFMSESVTSTIANRESEDIYCMYTEYQSNEDGPYTVLIGHKVTGTLELTETLTEINIAEGRYFEFDSSGIQPATVIKTWKEIWQAKYPRSYQADFDVYQKDGVKTFLSVSTR